MDDGVDRWQRMGKEKKTGNRHERHDAGVNWVGGGPGFLYDVHLLGRLRLNPSWGNRKKLVDGYDGRVLGLEVHCYVG